jgi:hypothetical protein
MGNHQSMGLYQSMGLHQNGGLHQNVGLQNVGLQNVGLHQSMGLYQGVNTYQRAADLAIPRVSDDTGEEGEAARVSNVSSGSEPDHAGRMSDNAGHKA